MQDRMKKHQLNDGQITDLLKKASVGTIATIDENGYPYAVPVHFIYNDDMIYFHGLPKGKKINNIMANNKICFQIYDMKGLILDDAPCDVNTEYESVVIMGMAAIVKDQKLKATVLSEIVGKYTSHLKETKLPDNMIKSTAVVEITIKECTGKYYK